MWQFYEINGTFFSDIFGQKLTKIDKKCSIFMKNEQKVVKILRIFPKKKCHLIRKIGTLFENFDPPFSEKLMISTKSLKKEYVPN